VVLDTVLELAHGITRADTAERRDRRQRFLDELLIGVPIQPVIVPIALRAGQIDGDSPSVHLFGSADQSQRWNSAMQWERPTSATSD
jgi:predicted nucleic acid-binding protein